MVSSFGNNLIFLDICTLALNYQIGSGKLTLLDLFDSRLPYELLSSTQNINISIMFSINYEQAISSAAK